MDDKTLYLDATQEVDGGKQNPALWAKAMALTEGNEKKAKYRYITLRVEELSNKSAAALPVDPAPSIDSGDDGLRSKLDNTLSVEASTSPAPKANDKLVPEGWMILPVIAAGSLLISETTCATQPVHSFIYSGPVPQTFHESPSLTERVKRGELPPVDECMTRQPMLQLAAEHTRVSYHRANELALEGI